jgi:hypothetical protein
MDQFIHLPELRVIVCKTCKYAVLPSNIDAHFTPAEPHGFTKEVRRRIIAEIAQVRGLIGNEEALQRCEDPFPADTSAPIAALADPQPDGFRCAFEVDGSACPYVCGAKRNIRKHCSKEHHWQNPHRKGRRKEDPREPVPDVPWRSGAWYQRLFVQGSKSGFFEVHRGQRDDERSPAPESQWEKVEKVIDAGRARVAERERRKIAAIDESKEPSPWLRFNGWPAHLGSFDPVELRKLVGPVDVEKEAELNIIHSVFDEMIQEAQGSAVKDVVGKPALVEVNRKERGKKSKKPFNSKMSSNTFRKYTACGKQLLSYIIRCDDLDENERPAFKLTRQQKASFEQLMEMTDQLSDYHEEGRSDDDAVCQEARADVQQALLQFWIALLDHDLVDNEYRSPIISGLAVLGIREDQG